MFRNSKNMVDPAGKILPKTLIALWLLGPLTTSQSATLGLPTIDSIARFQSLSSEEYRRSYPVRIEGVVLYSDPEWRLLWIANGSSVFFQSTPVTPDLPPPGSRIALSGQTKLINGRPKIGNLKATKIGKGDFPSPELLTPKMINAGTHRNNWVRLGGTVVDRRYRQNDRHLVLLVAFRKTHQLRLVLRDLDSQQADRLIGSKIEATGVVAPAHDHHLDNSAPVQVHVPNLDHLTVYDPGPPTPFDAPQHTISNIRELFRVRQEAELITIRGKIAKVRSRQDITLKANDSKATIEVKLRVAATLRTNQYVETAGIVWRSDNESPPYLDRALVRPIDENDDRAPASSTFLPVLHTTQSVRSLTTDQADSKYPTEIKGIVSYHDPRWRVTFIVDATGGIYVDWKDHSLPVRVGDRVLVRGTTASGGFSPMVKASEVNKIGKSQMPAPRTPEFGRLISGAEDCQWVQMDGMVEKASKTQRNLQLLIRHAEGTFDAYVMGAAATLKKTNWIGSRVRLTGVCGVKANSQRQAMRILLHTPGMEYVEFIDAAPRNPFDRPTYPLSKLLNHNSEDTELKQVKVAGTVTYAGTSGQCALQDETRAILIRFPSNSMPATGDAIEVIGFPAPGRLQPTIRQTQWRKTGKADLPSPHSLDPHLGLDHESDARFVTMDATVLENHAGSAIPTLTLQSKGVVFSADISAQKENSAVADIAPGSIVRIAGVCSIQADEWSTPRAFRILVPSDAAIKLLRSPPRITIQHIGAGAGVMALLGLAAMIWNLTLRRRVTVQTLQIRQDVEEKGRLSARYDELVENAGDVIFTLNPAREFTAMNTAAERIFGRSRGNLLGTAVTDHFDEQSIEHLHRALAVVSPEHPSTSIELCTTDKTTPRVLDTALHLQPHPEGIDEIQCIARDVTGRQELEAQLRQMQKMESVGQLAAGVAHDYNNLMSVIVANADIMIEEKAARGEHGEMLQEIHDAGARAAKLTSQLLAFSRRQFIKPVALDAGEILTDLATMLRRLIGENIDLQTEIPDALPSIRADQSLLEQAVINIAVNARDAMPSGGNLKISAEAVTLTHGDADRHPDAMPGPHLRISIDDTGAGIESDVLPKIFDPFFTTKDIGKGTGLGLSTVYGIAKQHEGWVEVNTAPEQGTSFHLFIPTTESETEEPPSDSPNGDHTGTETIMVVEDEEAVRLTMTKVLRRAGYRVIPAADGPSALEIWSHKGNSVDLLVTDMIMPGGISGRELADDIRASHPELLTLFCSGYSVEFTGLTALTDQERLLPKPFENKMLVKSVRELLDSANVSRN